MNLSTEVAAVWPEIVQGVSKSLSDKSLQTRLRMFLESDKVVPVGISDDGQLVLECPTSLFQEQIRRSFAEALVVSTQEILAVEISGVRCRVSAHAMREHRSRIGDGVDPQATVATERITRRRERRFGRGYKILEDFVVGSCNCMAYNMVKRIIDEPDNPVNPLFIHGSSGQGKTHLEQGLALAFNEQFPSSKVLYLTCEQFRNMYLSACDGREKAAALQAMRVKLRHADLLLIDDIHFLSRGQMEQTKEELFATINELQLNGKKVVITSDAHPNDIKYLSERFVERFIGGLVVSLDRPDPQTRREVVAAKARGHQREFPDPVIDFIADNITDNMREIEGAVNKVVAYADSFQRPIDLPLARQALADLLARDVGEPRLKVILRTVADYYDLTVDDILSKRRAGKRSEARHVAMYLLKASGGETYAEIGRHFGIKSHGSVSYACETVNRYRANQAELDRFISDLLMRLGRR
ncbi:MAG: DnaA ATPase domain-containing protein [Planctomycetota bacterium]